MPISASGGWIRLWLERVETTKGDPVFTGAELFPKSAEGSRARADWFSGEIRYGTGALVYYQHDGFKRNLEREWVAEIFEGRVGRGTKAYRNRLYKCGVEMMDNVVRVAAAFDSLYVGTLPDQLALSVVFAPDSTGRVAQIDRARLLIPGGEKIEDAADPRLQAAVQAFRSATRWDAYWIEGMWKKQSCTLTLRRNGKVCTPPLSGEDGRNRRCVSQAALRAAGADRFAVRKSAAEI